jgi:hypothetical protein
MLRIYPNDSLSAIPGKGVVLWFIEVTRVRESTWATSSFRVNTGACGPTLTRSTDFNSASPHDVRKRLTMHHKGRSAYPLDSPEYNIL